MNSHEVPWLQPIERPWTPELEELLTSLMPPGVAPLGLFKTLAHHQDVLRMLRVMAPFVYNSRVTSVETRELIIQRVCAKTKAEYEWGVHAQFFGRRANLHGSRLRQITHELVLNEEFSTRERAVVQAVDDLCRGAEISDASWSNLLRTGLSTEEILDLIALVGFYHMIAFFVRSIRVQPEPESPTFEEARSYR